MENNPIIVLGKMPKIIPPQEPIPILECSLNFHRTNLLKKALESIITLNDDVPVVIKSSMEHGLVIQAHPERRSNNSYVVASINVPKSNFIRHCFAANYTHFTVPINMLMEGLISLGDKDDMSIVTYFQYLLEYIHGYMHIKSLRFLTERPTIVYTQMLMHECQYFNYVIDTIYEGFVGIPSAKLVDILRHYDNSEGDDLDISIYDTHVKLSVGDDEGVILDKDQNQCIIGGFYLDTEVSVPLDDVRDSWYLALRFTKVIWIFISGDGYALYCFPILPLGNLFYCFEDDDDDDDDDEEEEEEEEDDGDDDEEEEEDDGDDDDEEEEDDGDDDDDEEELDCTNSPSHPDIE